MIQTRDVDVVMYSRLLLRFQILGCFYFFFFKQKTAYEIMPSLVGSEMCIRDRYMGICYTYEKKGIVSTFTSIIKRAGFFISKHQRCQTFLGHLAFWSKL
eukprot:TRINITY_DN29811_c0_g1_i1.p4 TRINITY_DN29811_c0_g1~~TRINITY_DN29811_c0_g1_i1.p4  ORF type:complete len:100 (+),score=11.15 TRINITY_DN29811_c0_g1_i1:36-335(+)